MSDIVAALPIEIPMGEVARYIEDPAWGMEQKHDGTRCLMAHDGKRWRMRGRDGGLLKHTAATQWAGRLEERLESFGIPTRMVLDGEVMLADGQYRVWDAPLAPGNLLVRRSAIQSYAGLHRILTPLARKPDDKRRLWDGVKQRGGEGIVLKRVGTEYPRGRTDWWLKAKFIKTADVVVMGAERGVNASGREVGSIAFGLQGPDGALYRLGSCSAIGKPSVGVGDVIEVAYLYWSGESLIQPRMVRLRPDKSPVDCGPDQLQEYSRTWVRKFG